MTRLDIDGGGYTHASQMLGDANRMAAVAVGALGSALADSGTMAGDSSFADEFAAAYDEGATAVLAAFDDAVGALGSLCRLARCSLENHRRAEESSISSALVVASDPSLMSGALYDAATTPPPTSLGGDAGFLPGWANVILDHVEGFVWPDADVDRLRSTAGAWRKAAGDLDFIGTLCGQSIVELYEERSPEVPLAADVIGDLRIGILDLATACTQLAECCEQYADSVETQRELILDLVGDLIRDAVLIQAAGFVLGLVTAGSTNAVAAWINSGKLAAQVPRFKAFLDAIRLVGSTVASTLRSGGVAVARAQATFRRMVHARMVASGFERGAAYIGRKLTWLDRHEGGAKGAHTLGKHVGRSDRYLYRRLKRNPELNEVSTFTNETVAERSIKSVLASKSDDFEEWLASNKYKRPFEDTMDYDVGRIMDRADRVRPGRGVRVVLVKDSSMPEGYRILTALVR